MAADKIINDITLLFKTKLDEKSKQEVGKQLKGILENAVITFDEAESRKNLMSIITMLNALFEKAEIKGLDVERLLKMPSQEALREIADISVDRLQTAFDLALEKSGGIKIDFGDIDLSPIIEPLERLVQELSEIGERVASTTKKSVREIENSVRSLGKTKKLDKTMAGIEKTLGAINTPHHYTSAKKATTALESARDKYAESVANNDPWEIQYQHLLTFVSRYEAMSKKIKPLVDESNPEFKQLYDILAPKAGAAKISLEHFVDVVRGNELTEHKDKPWARENTLKEVKQILKNGIVVKDGPGDGGGDDGGTSDGDSTPPWEDVEDNKSKKINTTVPVTEGLDVSADQKAREEAEKKAQAEKEAAEAAERRRITEEKAAKAAEKAIKVYRGVIPPEDEDETLTRRQILDKVDGSEWWTNKKGVAQTYADQDSDGAILVGTISPKNPLIIDAGKYNFDEFAKMPGILSSLDKFPELMAKIDSGEDINDIQRYINDTARTLGHDVVEFINVNDVANPDGFKELGTSYAVLDDSILKVSGAFEMLSYDVKEGLGEYAKKASPEGIPDYYLPPEDYEISDSVVEANGSLTEQTTLLEKIQKLTAYIDDEYLSAGKHLSDFLDDLQSESVELDTELKELLTTLRLIDENDKPTFTVKHNGEEGGGTTHNGALISDDFVLIERDDYEGVKNSHLPDDTRKAAENGLNVAEVMGYLPSKHTGGFFDVQSTAKGHNLFEDGVLSQDVVNATDEQLEQLVQAFIKARDYGFNIENGGSNVVYDKEKGFSFYDLEELSAEDADFWNGLSESTKKLYALEDLFSLFSGLNRDHANAADDVNVDNLAERIKSIIEVNDIVPPDAVDADGRNYEDIYDDVFSGNVDEEYDDILAILDAEAAAHRKSAAAIEEEARAQEKLNAERAEVPPVEETPSISTPEVVPDEKSVATGENKVAIDGESLRSVLDAITYKVKIVQDADVDVDDEKKETIDTEALKAVLGAITYNVKIAHDDADKTANKIALDESGLEATLNRVFANILNPIAEESETEPAKEPWALESTLSTTIKGVLDNIQTNTEKIGTAETSAVDTIAGTDLDGRLAEIKAVLDSINNKIARGGVITKKDTPTAERTASRSEAPKEHANRKSEINSLAKDYERLGKLRAQFEKDGNLETKAMLQNLAEEVKRKRASLSLTTDEIAELRNKSDVAYNAEKRLLDAAEEQKRIDDARKASNKAATKEERKRLSDAKKLAKRQAMTGKAGSAIGRAEAVWMEAEGLDSSVLPEDFEGRIEEYYVALDKLRLKHHEISTSEVITDEQQKELIEQTAEVNRLTEEISALVSEYQRLSGSNTETMQVSPLGDKASITEYEQALKQAVMTHTNGKAQIKGFNAETKTLTYTVKTGKNEFTEYTAAVRHLDNQLVTTQGTTKRTETFLEATKRKMKELTSYMSGMAIISRIGQELRRGIQYVREIDLALTELKKVTDETEETYDKFLDTAAKTGARLGTTISAVTEATATFAKLGYTMEQATEMAESAIVYKNVGDNIESTEDAADSIISTMKGFKLEATESMRIVDSFNEVGNRFAITSRGIGEALRLSASALSEGGNSLDESIGLITAAM